MKAIVCPRSGPPEVLRVTDVPKPMPKKHEVLIKVHATTVTAGDWRLRRLFSFLVRLIANPLTPWKAPILGLELSGEIEEVGDQVKLFEPGDKVFAASGFGFGGYAEYKCISEKRLTKNPTSMSYEEAATVPIGGCTAVHFLRDKAAIQTRKGQKVLIYGASGSVGTYSVQLAKFYEAEVTGVCGLNNLDLVKSLGADRVLDYKTTDFAQEGRHYDIIFDTVGKRSFKDIKDALAPDGTFVTVNKGLARSQVEKLVFLRELIDAGHIRSVIDRRYPMEQIVEAHRYVEAGHKKGNVVINVI